MAWEQTASVLSGSIDPGRRGGRVAEPAAKRGALSLYPRGASPRARAPPRRHHQRRARDLASQLAQLWPTTLISPEADRRHCQGMITFRCINLKDLFFLLSIIIIVFIDYSSNTLLSRLRGCQSQDLATRG